MDSDILGIILQCLELPSLRALEWSHQEPAYHEYFSEAESMPPWPRDIFLDFISRSGCKLSKLWIQAGPSEDDVLQCLMELPSVVDLAIGPEPCHHCPRKLMQALTLGSRSGPEGKDLVPKLEHLQVHGRWCACEEMMEAIESRFAGVEDMADGKWLKSVTLFTGLVREHGLGDTEERLWDCVSAGLRYKEWIFS